MIMVGSRMSTLKMIHTWVESPPKTKAWIHNANAEPNIHKHRLGMRPNRTAFLEVDDFTIPNTRLAKPQTPIMSGKIGSTTMWSYSITSGQMAYLTLTGKQTVTSSLVKKEGNRRVFSAYSISLDIRIQLTKMKKYTIMAISHSIEPIITMIIPSCR